MGVCVGRCCYCFGFRYVSYGTMDFCFVAHDGFGLGASVLNEYLAHQSVSCENRSNIDRDRQSGINESNMETVSKACEKNDTEMVNEQNECVSDERRDNGSGTSNPLLPDHMKKEVASMKGDAIGSTLYSECWVLKTLIMLSKIDNDSFLAQSEEEKREQEVQLCSLWDMTFEPDVIAFLMKHDFINIAMNIIQMAVDPRITEIMVGIIGNMSSSQNVRLYLSRSAGIGDIINLLSSPDTRTLLQLVRLFNTCAWHVSHLAEHAGDSVHSEENTWVQIFQDNGTVLNQYLSFILNSSTNEELLVSGLELLNNLCCIPIKGAYFSEFIATEEMLSGILEAQRQLVCGDEEDDNICMWGSEVEKCTENWAAVLDAFTLHNKGVEVLGNERQNVMRGICRVLDTLGLAENILPLDTRKVQILQYLIGVLLCYGVKHTYKPPALLPRILTILSHIPVANGGTKDIEMDASFEENLQSSEDDVIEEYEETREKLIEYCKMVLLSTQLTDFQDAFGNEPLPKIKHLLTELAKSKDEKLGSLVKIIEAQYGSNLVS